MFENLFRRTLIWLCMYSDYVNLESDLKIQILY